MMPFERWGPWHLATLVLTLVVPCVLAAWTRLASRGRVRRLCEWAFVAVLIGGTLGGLAWRHYHGYRPAWRELAPMHLCDWALWACVVACLGRRRLAYECAYFWGLAGTLQGLVTPDLAVEFPSMQFILFFMGHSGIVGCVLYFVTSGIFRPRWRSVLHAYLGLLVYGVSAGIYNAVAGTNYGYLCAKPGISSLLDHFGPWPWYIGSLLAVAAANFVLLYLPWLLADGWRNRHRQGSAGRSA